MHVFKLLVDTTNTFLWTEPVSLELAGFIELTLFWHYIKPPNVIVTESFIDR